MPSSTARIRTTRNRRDPASRHRADGVGSHAVTSSNGDVEAAYKGDLLFWMALLFSLSLGFAAAFPVNVTLVKVGVKEGLTNPAEMGGGRAAQAAD